MRSYHFAMALAESSKVSACVLAKQRDGVVPPELAVRCRTVIRPPYDTRNGDHRAVGIAGGLRRAVIVTATPWRQNGKQLMIAGGGNCVFRSENQNGHKLGTLHTLYAELLQLEANVSRRLFEIYPPSALIRIEEFEAVLPEIAALNRQHNFDVIWCEHSYLYPFASYLHRICPDARLVCNAHNVESVLQERIASMMKTPRARRWLRTEAAISRKWETQMMYDAEMVYCCSDRDAVTLQKLAPKARAKIEVVPNGVDTDHFKASDNSGPCPTLLFAGTAGFPPNDDAVGWMVNEILPLIRKRSTECRLILAGLQAAAHWGKYAGTDGLIEVASDVPDMRKFFNQASVCVVPLRSGSGTRLKILEAMSMGRAVVSTTVGAEGIEAIPGTHLCIADTPDDFAREVASLLSDASRRQQMQQAGRELVCRRYHWDNLMEKGMTAFISHIQPLPEPVAV